MIVSVTSVLTPRASSEGSNAASTWSMTKWLISGS